MRVLWIVFLLCYAVLAPIELLQFDSGSVAEETAFLTLDRPLRLPDLHLAPELGGDRCLTFLAAIVAPVAAVIAAAGLVAGGLKERAETSSLDHRFERYPTGSGDAPSEEKAS